MIVIKFTRHFFQGNLKGLTHDDEIEFTDEILADQWIQGINKNADLKKIDYTITLRD